MEDISILYAPVSLRYSFAKFVYISSGLLFEFDISKPGQFQNQSGIGLFMGPGFQYEFRNGMAVIMSPYINFHSWISYNNWINNDKIFEASVRIGFLYSLN
jgi:hypothetical protein